MQKYRITRSVSLMTLRFPHQKLSNLDPMKSTYQIKALQQFSPALVALTITYPFSCSIFNQIHTTTRHVNRYLYASKTVILNCNCGPLRLRYDKSEIFYITDHFKKIRL